MSSTKPSPLPAPNAVRTRAPSAAGAALALGLIAALLALVAGPGRRRAPRADSARGAVARFAAAWERGDYARDVRAARADAPSGARPRSGFVRTYRAGRRDGDAAKPSRPARPGEIADGSVDVPVTLQTRIFGTLHGHAARSPIEQTADGEPGVDWRAELRVPGPAPRRAARARDARCRRARRSRRATARVLAQGDARLGGPTSAARSRGRRHASAPRRRSAPPSSTRAACPTGAAVGLTGLEREFDERAAGTPGGTLLRGQARARHALAAARQHRAHDDRPEGPEAPRWRRSPAASAGSPSCARAPARCSRSPGIAYSAPQPPGLDVQDRHARRRARVRRGQAHGAASRSRPRRRSRASSSRTPTASRAAARSRASFARVLQLASSPRSAPSSARAGSSRPPSASASTRSRRWPAPRARRSRPRGEIGDDLAVGSTRDRPGQGAGHAAADGDVAAAIGERRPAPGADAAQAAATGASSVRRHDAAPWRARSRATCARWCADGTGVGAAIPGVKVAGKTGTAELRTTVKEEPQPLAAGRDADAAAGGRHDRHRRLVRRLRPAGQPARRGRACCSSARAPAATTAAPGRPRPCSRPR